MSIAQTKSSLSARQRRLLETMQNLNFGFIEDLRIAAGEPIFSPPLRIVKDIKLGAADNCARPELHHADFALKREHLELFQYLRSLGDGRVERIEVKAGLPFRFMVEQMVSEYP